MSAVLEHRPLAKLVALQAHADEFTGMRRDIHRHPELGFQEFRTSELVAERLTQWGYSVTRGLGGTGVVGQLQRGTGAKRLGLRADMDALPIVEATGLAHASCHTGVMHACGHDGHTAMLLAAAQHLAEHGDFSGTLNLIFQPAEEGLGGAVKMMEDGLFARFPCDAIFGMHNMPGYPAGHLALRDGPAMASSDSVVTVGAFHAGEANNVIPPHATLRLSVRALDRDVRTLLQQRITALAQQQAASFGCTAEVEYRPGYCVLVNTRAETDFAREVALELVGPGRVTLQAPALPGSEDFAFMLEKVPGSYLLIGNGDGTDGGTFAGHACMVHNPGYDFNDASLPVGAAYWALLAERFLVE